MKDNYIHETESYDKNFIRHMEVLNLFLETSLRFDIIGIEHIPANGAAILVMNHSALPIDGMLLVARYLKLKKRLIRAMINKNLRKHILIRKGVQLWGGVDANAHNALHLLKNGELLLIYPGGPQEALKDDNQQYQLIWDDETGFIRLSLLTGAPVIPVASVGLDENFHLISQGLFLNRLLFGKDAFLLPIIRPRHIIPQKVTLYVGEPIKFDYPPETAKNAAVVKELQQRVKGVLENMISQHVGKK